MFKKARDLNPFMRLICTMQLANLVLIFAKIYGITSGNWVVDSTSWVTLGLSFFIFFGLVWIQRMAGSRIDAIAKTANSIIRTGDITQRIQDPYAGKETLSLITVINQMLDEIEQLMHGVRTASDNIAHDLRHPLTRLRNHIEELRTSVTDEECAEEAQKLSDLVSECDALLGTFSAILRISNIETARRHGGFREVQLHSLMQDVIELYEPIAAEKKITIIIDARPTRAIGDKDLLFQALTNLIDNAIKYTPEGGGISIEIMPHEQGGKIVIRDSGRGIPDEHKPNVFRRFYRVDPARSMPGTGLGLSLVSAIVKLHQGTISLADNTPNGLTITVIL